MANYKVKLFKNGKYEGWCGVLKSRAEAEACGNMQSHTIAYNRMQTDTTEYAPTNDNDNDNDMIVINQYHCTHLRSYE